MVHGLSITRGVFTRRRERRTYHQRFAYLSALSTLGTLSHGLTQKLRHNRERVVLAEWCGMTWRDAGARPTVVPT